MTPAGLTAIAAGVYHHSELRLAIAAYALKATVEHLEAASLELASLPIVGRLDAWRCIYLDAIDRRVRLVRLAQEHQQVWGIYSEPAAVAAMVFDWRIRQARADIAHLEQAIEARTPGRLSLVSRSWGGTDQREGGAPACPSPNPPTLTVIPSSSSRPERVVAFSTPRSGGIPLGTPQPDRRSVPPHPIAGIADRPEAPAIEDTGPSGQGSAGNGAPVPSLLSRLLFLVVIP